jgi:hypothetical protein
MVVVADDEQIVAQERHRDSIIARVRDDCLWTHAASEKLSDANGIEARVAPVIDV